MPEPHDFRISHELELLRALIESSAESRPSREELEEGLESGIAKMMLLEGWLRDEMNRPGGMPPTEDSRQVHKLVEEIRALREALAELRARTNPEGSAPLARGFVLRRAP